MSRRTLLEIGLLQRLTIAVALSAVVIFCVYSVTR